MRHLINNQTEVMHITKLRGRLRVIRR